MCGIAGILHPDTETYLPVVQRMTDALAHRGRDGEALWQGNGIVLGHRRLSIIDLSETGKQPISNQAGTVWVTANGEIYNYKELRDDLTARGHTFRGTSDTETVPHAYEAFGNTFAEKLDGMFAFALWDAARRSLLLVRDRTGKKPLYYAHLDSGIAFASEMKALFLVPGVDLTVRPQAIYDYLSFGVVPGPKTTYRGIHRVPPGTIMSFSPQAEEKASRYWAPHYQPKHDIGEAEAIEEIDRRLRRAVQIRLRSDVQVGSFLSGGIDSGLVTAIAALESSKPLRTFCIGVDDPNFDERALAREVTERYQTDHSEFVMTNMGEDEIDQIVGHYDEPYADYSALPSFAVSSMAAEHVKVVLNGDGGDEIFAGYRHYVAALFYNRISQLGPLPGALARSLVHLLPTPQTSRSLYQFAHRFLRVAAADPGDRYLVLTKDLFSRAQKNTLFDGTALNDGALKDSKRLLDIDRSQEDILGPLDQMTEWNMVRLLADDLLIKMDMASMAHTLEARSPLLDHHLIDFVTRLPEHLRLRGSQTKPLLRKLAERYLPDDIVNAPKKGFEIPLQRWMTEDMYAALSERLTDQSAFAGQMFNRAAIDSFLTMQGWDKKQWASAAWSLLCLETWWARHRATI